MSCLEIANETGNSLQAINGIAKNGKSFSDGFKTVGADIKGSGKL